MLRRLNHLILISGAALGLTSFLSGTGSTMDKNEGLLLVINKSDQTLSVVDPDAGRQLAAIPVGGKTGHEVAVSPDGQTAWVPIYGDSGVGLPGSNGQSISVIDLNKRSKVASIGLSAPARPHCAIFCRRDGKLYVTTELLRSLTVIDPATRKVVDSVPTGQPESHMAVISSDGLRAYTANVGAGTVSAIDLQHKKVLAVIPVARTVQRIAMSPDNHWVFTADQTKPQIAVIDTMTDGVSKWISLSAVGYGMTPTPDGRWLLVAQPSSQSVAFVNLATMKEESAIRVPAAPQEIVVRPDGKTAYVSCDQSKQVAAINLSSRKVDKLITVGTGSDGLAWAAQQIK